MIYTKKQLFSNTRNKYANYIEYVEKTHCDFSTILCYVLAHILKQEEISVKLLTSYELSEEQLKQMYMLLDDICINKYPWQYVLKKACIYDTEVYVTRDTLVPRFDTEVIIDTTIQYINENNYLKVLDMCTGTGIISMAILKNTKVSEVHMTDIDIKALNVASINAKEFIRIGKVKAYKSDVLDECIKEGIKFDCITSNPPYISEGEYASLDEYVKKEPYISLVAGKTGLEIYERLYEQASSVLNPGGAILVEIGNKQAKSVINIINKYPWYKEIKVYPDIHGVKRVVVCRFLNK